MTSLIIIFAIFLAIALGYLTKINTGFFAFVFAYIIGCFMLNYSTSAVTAMWPLNIFVVIMGVTLFYNVAITNGTLEKVALNILYRCKNLTAWLPLILFGIATLIAAMGAGYFAVMSLICPVALLVCEKTGMSKVTGVIVASFGALAGANFMSSASGLIFRNLIETTEYAEQAFLHSTWIWIFTFISPIIIITFLAMTSKKHMQDVILSINKPAPFTKKQKLNLYLILVMVVLVLSAPILHLLFPNVAWITLFNKNIHVGYIGIILTIIALACGLANEKAVIAKVPWNTLIMICGVGILIKLAVKAGTIKLLVTWISGSIPVWIIPVFLALVSGFMSFFSSTLGVVAPTMFPVVPILSATTGVHPSILFTCIILGAQSTGAVSPFSSGGSLALGACSNEDDREKLFGDLMFKATPLIFLWTLFLSFICSIVL